jgi:uncharacterized DUF497 family protein
MLLLVWGVPCNHAHVAEQFHFQFEWDPRKARQNVNKHRVTFERAATIFLDPRALSEFDEEHSRSEDGSLWVWIAQELYW